jgi:hypothetical protein
MGQNTNFPTFPTIKRKPDNNYFYGYILTNIFLFIALCCHTKIGIIIIDGIIVTLSHMLLHLLLLIINYFM